MSYIQEYGHQLEHVAKKILEKEFESVEWVSNKYPFSPFDLKCISKEEVFYIDVKGCSKKIIYISKNKIKKLDNYEIYPFYFMLFLGDKFHLISYFDLKKNADYKIINSKSKGRSAIISFYLNDEKWMKYYAKKYYLKKIIKEKVIELIGQINKEEKIITCQQ